MAAIVSISRVKSSGLGAETQGGSLVGTCYSWFLKHFFIQC